MVHVRKFELACAVNQAAGVLHAVAAAIDNSTVDHSVAVHFSCSPMLHPRLNTACHHELVHVNTFTHILSEARIR